MMHGLCLDQQCIEFGRNGLAVSGCGIAVGRARMAQPELLAVKRLAGIPACRCKVVITTLSLKQESR